MQTIHGSFPIPATNYEELHTAKIVTSVLRPFKAIARMLRDRQETRNLLNLDPHLLKDIGLERSDIVDALNAGLLRGTSEHLNIRRSENRKNR